VGCVLDFDGSFSEMEASRGVWGRRQFASNWIGENQIGSRGMCSSPMSFFHVFVDALFSLLQFHLYVEPNKWL
jgi:hypothetical protein